MATIAHTHHSQTRLDTRAAYGLAGYAIVATHFGLRFGTLSLSRPFALDLTRIPERAQLLTLLYAGHAGEAALVGTQHGRLIADRSLHYAGLREALVTHTGAIDARETHSARLRALALVRQPANWAAIGSVAERLAAGEMLGYLTARRIIQPAVPPSGAASQRAEESRTTSKTMAPTSSASPTRVGADMTETCSGASRPKKPERRV